MSTESRWCQSLFLERNLSFWFPTLRPNIGGSGERVFGEVYTFFKNTYYYETPPCLHVLWCGPGSVVFFPETIPFRSGF